MGIDTEAGEKARQDDDALPDQPDKALWEKTQEIHDACRWRDIDRLKALAEDHGGFLSDELRRLAWPILLGDDTSIEYRERLEDGSWKGLPRHRDEDQVELDVNRAFIYYPNDLSDSELKQRKVELSDLITEVLRRHPFLCYFQGYHDICQVFLLVLDVAATRARLTARMSVLRIRDFMLPTLAPALAQLRLIPDILAAADPPLRCHVAGIQPYYALSGTLTLYAHNIEGYRDIVRLFDILLASEPVFSVYMYAQIAMDRREELLETPAEDTDMLHFILSKVPQRLDLEALIKSTKILYQRHPPETLPSWRSISSHSCLKTARSLQVCSKQSLDDGEALFQKQTEELHWAERREAIAKAMWQYRRPVGAAGLAIAMGFAALYLKRNPGSMHYLTAFISRLASS